jgi:transcriptional regulator with XRE-family HTH domain
MFPQSEPSPPPRSSPLLQDETSDVERVQVKLVEALHELQKGGAAAAANLSEAIRCVQKALTLLGDPDDSGELGPVDWLAFATRLRERREDAELSQEALAELVGVSSTTIRNLERQRKRPGRGLMLKLLAVPQLNLRVSDIELDAELSPAGGWTPTSWFAPKYDPAAMVSDMVEVLNGEGGQVEQTLLYFDPQSASDWMATCNSASYVAAYRTHLPLAPIAQHISDCIEGAPLRVNALGCGDGKVEVMLAEHLLQSLANPSKLELYLLDISHVLLNAAHKHATETLLNVPVLTVHGNFHELPRYSMLTQPRERCRRLYTLLGFTLVNLRDEVRFFRDTLSCCAPGDLFLCDILIAYGSPDRPEEIHRADPALLNKVRPSHAAWMAGPLRRYCRGLSDVEFDLELDTRCPVPGSYGLDFIATVKMQGGLPDRRFLMSRTRRYDPTKLAESLASVGWQPELVVPYGQGAGGQATLALMLFRKR